MLLLEKLMALVMDNIYGNIFEAERHRRYRFDSNNEVSSTTFIFATSKHHRHHCTYKEDELRSKLIEATLLLSDVDNDTN